MSIENFGEIGRIDQSYRVTVFSRLNVPEKAEQLDFVLDVLSEGKASRYEVIK